MKPIIRLIPSDFDSLTRSCLMSGTDQYSEPRDCPIFRACKRLGMNVRSVITNRIDFVDGTSIWMNGNARTVENCRKQLRKGKPAHIEMYP